jgi:hypothetical protein
MKEESESGSKEKIMCYILYIKSILKCMAMISICRKIRNGEQVNLIIIKKRINLNIENIL